MSKATPKQLFGANYISDSTTITFNLADLYPLGELTAAEAHSDTGNGVKVAYALIKTFSERLRQLEDQPTMVNSFEGSYTTNNNDTVSRTYTQTFNFIVGDIAPEPNEDVSSPSTSVSSAPSNSYSAPSGSASSSPSGSASSSASSSPSGSASSSPSGSASSSPSGSASSSPSGSASSSPSNASPTYTEDSSFVFPSTANNGGNLYVYPVGQEPFVQASNTTGVLVAGETYLVTKVNVSNGNLTIADLDGNEVGSIGSGGRATNWEVVTQDISSPSSSIGSAPSSSSSSVSAPSNSSSSVPSSPSGSVSSSAPSSSVSPFAVQGYDPLYETEEQAQAASPSNTAHEHELGIYPNYVMYYMPDGVTLYHGNYVEDSSAPSSSSSSVSAPSTSSSSVSAPSSSSSVSSSSGPSSAPSSSSSPSGSSSMVPSSPSSSSSSSASGSSTSGSSSSVDHNQAALDAYNQTSTAAYVNLSDGYANYGLVFGLSDAISAGTNNFKVVVDDVSNAPDSAPVYVKDTSNNEYVLYVNSDDQILNTLGSPITTYEWDSDAGDFVSYGTSNISYYRSGSTETTWVAGEFDVTSNPNFIPV